MPSDMIPSMTTTLHCGTCECSPIWGVYLGEYGTAQSWHAHVHARIVQEGRKDADQVERLAVQLEEQPVHFGLHCLSDTWRQRVTL